MFLTGTLICALLQILRQAEHIIIMHTHMYTLVPHVHSTVRHYHPHVKMLACPWYGQYHS